MTDTLLTTAHQEEALSCIYVRAVAARAGYTTSVSSPDQDGVDPRVQAGGEMRSAFDLQLKATINLKRKDDSHIRYPLKNRNYNLLRIETKTPRLLVVFDLPNDEGRWMTITADELVLRHRAYWFNLRGREEIANRVSITVEIPEGNLFDIEDLHRLMEQSRVGRIQ